MIGWMERYGDRIGRLAAEGGVPPALAAAIVLVESDGVTWAMRFEPEFHDRYIVGNPDYQEADATERIGAATSWGLMQIMGATARERGFAGRYFAELCDPEKGLFFGIAHLARCLARYGETAPAVAAYNAGSARRRGDRFVNQEYVDRVTAALEITRGRVG